MKPIRLSWQWYGQDNWRGRRGPWHAQVLRIGRSWCWCTERVVALWVGDRPQNGLTTPDALKGYASTRRGAQRASQKAAARMQQARVEGRKRHGA